jgi:DUF4097 and DUF4098 domain-containing protein YvlB
MITILAAHAILTLALPQLAPDTVVAVTRGSRLDVVTGTVDVRVEIRAWGRDEVGVDASRNMRLTREGSLVRVRPMSSGRGPQGRGRTPATYIISIPTWLPVSIEGSNASVTIQGVAADIAVETVNGPIRIRGGEGRIEAYSVQSSVTVEEARGPVEATSMNADVRVIGATGQVQAESVNGDIRIAGGQSTDVLATTVNGGIDLEVPILSGGLYRLSTHNGRVRMTIQEGASAAVTASTYAGDFRTTFPISLTERTRTGRATFMIGSGSARIEASSFNGTIEFRRPGEPVGRGG